MGRPLTWLAIAGVAVVALAAAVDAVRHPIQPGRLRTTSTERTAVRTPPPPCREDQLALAIEFLDAPVALLRHVKGEPCRQQETPVSVRIVARHGEGNGLLLGPEGSFAGLFAPGVEAVIGFRYSPPCDERGPFVAVVRAGHHAVRERIPVLRCGIGSGASPAEERIRSFSERGISFRYPRDWNVAGFSTTVLPARLAVASYPLPSEAVGGDCGGLAAVEALPRGGALVILIDYGEGSPSAEFARRPARFRLAAGEFANYECFGTNTMFRFRLGGRALQSHVALGRDADVPLRRKALAILDSLTVDRDGD